MKIQHLEKMSGQVLNIQDNYKLIIIMNNDRLKVLVKQSKTFKDFNTCLDVINPFITNQKITKREIDKANNALLSYFGTFCDYKEKIKTPYYTICKYLSKPFDEITIFAHDRKIKTESGFNYLEKSTRTIYMSNEIITENELMQYKLQDTPSESEIVEAYSMYKKYTQDIRDIQEKINKLPFYYYFTN